MTFPPSEIISTVVILGALSLISHPLLAQGEPTKQTAPSPPSEPLPLLPKVEQKLVAPKLPVGADADEPVSFQNNESQMKSKALIVQKVEEQPAVLMEKDKPDFIPLFFDPEKNGVIYAHQEIEYDLTNPLILRIGPLSVTAAGVVMRMSRETGEFLEFDFGMELKKRFANMYMISFQWPVDLIPDGDIELFNDNGEVLWSRKVDESEVSDWRKFVSNKEITYNNEIQAKPDQKGEARPQFALEQLRVTGHDQSNFGLFGKQIFEIPVWQITQPFRFCVTKDSQEGRIALCSKRYRFDRKGGRYWVISESKSVIPKVLVNDKPVTLKGSAVFIDDKKPIKFAALMGNGTYFEFVSFPKKITIVDMVLNEEDNQVEVIGYGPPPLGEIERIERHNKQYWDFLNFMPTIGDFRKFWKARFPAPSASLFLRGYGGAPFKQPFIFDRLPRKTTRPRINIKSPSCTYNETVKLKGETTAEVSVSSTQQSAVNTSPTSFDWQFLAKERGQLNSSEILITDKKYTYRAFHEVYKGFPRELSARVTGVVSSELQIVVLAELAGQWWFEKILGWDNTRWSHQRWGVAAKYFQAVAAYGGNANAPGLIKLQVANVDTKYRLTQGIWGRDHTLGVQLDFQDVTIQQFHATMGGVGAYWARSMPRIFDNIFNIVPFMRYPKWVDVEGIIYALPLTTYNQLGVNAAVNFHGKVLWTDRLYGEAGFGLKIFSFSDLRIQQQIGLGIAYATLGLGYNF